MIDWAAIEAAGIAAATEALTRGAKTVAAKAVEHAPVGSPERAKSGKTYEAGRLKGEIRAEEAVLEDGVITARVVSPTPYAAYVEGVKPGRGAPQPYLRPAGHESRTEIAADVRASVTRAATAAIRGRPGKLIATMKVEGG